LVATLSRKQLNKSREKWLMLNYFLLLIISISHAIAKSNLKINQNFCGICAVFNKKNKPFARSLILFRFDF